MSSLDGFYSLSVSLSDVERRRYQSFRVRAVKHACESLQYLAARLLAFVHCYEPGVAFSQGLLEPKQPTIWKHDVIGELILWAEVGVPDKKKLQHEVRTHPDARHAVYFYQTGEAEEFCNSCLRGTNGNWPAELECYEINPEFADAAAELLQTRLSWDVTIVDNLVYLTTNGSELHTTITPVNIWERYQRAIGNDIRVGKN